MIYWRNIIIILLVTALLYAGKKWLLYSNREQNSSNAKLESELLGLNPAQAIELLKKKAARPSSYQFKDLEFSNKIKPQTNHLLFELPMLDPSKKGLMIYLGVDQEKIIEAEVKGFQLRRDHG